MPIEAVIFDMDGVLIDSEPLWQLAEKKVFSRLGIELSTEDCLKTQGLRVDEVVSYWFARMPWEGKEQKELGEEIVDELIHLIRERGEEMEGVTYIFNFLNAKKVRLGLASSSWLKIIDVVTERLGIRDRLEIMHSAEFEEFGKPHPAVYLTTAQKMGVNPERCLAFEDSINGVRSAKAAGMKCVFIPDPSLRSRSAELQKDLGADLVLDSLLEFDEGCFLRTADGRR
jgi:mannitol-1-/sugar-/sorbitol-6-/2-deoxyglucose-6-phosphatase